MMNYAACASDHLARAKQERGSNDAARLFYSALELRYGVEARLHEYRDAIRKRPRDQTWQVRILKKDVERVVDKFENPVAIYFHVPATSERIQMRYVPISDELKTIAERIGDYLHCIPADRLQRPQFWTELAALIDRGIALLSDAVSGDLLTPPMWQKKGGDVVITFDKGKMPKFFRKGAEIAFDLRLRVVSRTQRGITLKNTESKD